MAPPRSADPTRTREAVSALADWLRDDALPAPARTELGDAVRLTARTLATQAPGATVEVRVPPFVAVQCISGLSHTRGNPPNVVETDALTWLRLATGQLDWASAVGNGTVAASGTRTDLSDWLPLFS